MNSSATWGGRREGESVEQPCLVAIGGSPVCLLPRLLGGTNSPMPPRAWALGRGSRSPCLYCVVAPHTRCGRGALVLKKAGVCVMAPRQACWRLSRAEATGGAKRRGSRARSPRNRLLAERGGKVERAWRCVPSFLPVAGARARGCVCVCARSSGSSRLGCWSAASEAGVEASVVCARAEGGRAEKQKRASVARSLFFSPRCFVQSARKHRQETWQRRSISSALVDV